MALAPAPEKGTAGGKTTHKNGQDRGNGIGRVPENQAQSLAPGNLVDEAGGSGQKEADPNGKKGWRPGLGGSLHRRNAGVVSRESIIAQENRAERRASSRSAPLSRGRLLGHPETTARSQFPSRVPLPFDCVGSRPGSPPTAAADSRHLSHSLNRFQNRPALLGSS